MERPTRSSKKKKKNITKGEKKTKRKKKTTKGEKMTKRKKKKTTKGKKMTKRKKKKVEGTREGKGSRLGPEIRNVPR